MDYLDKGDIEWKIDDFLKWAKTELRYRTKHSSDSPDIFFSETNQNYKLGLTVELKKKKADEKDFPIVATVQLKTNHEPYIDADFIFSIVKNDKQVILVLTITQVTPDITRSVGTRLITTYMYLDNAHTKPGKHTYRYTTYRYVLVNIFFLKNMYIHRAFNRRGTLTFLYT
jgi:hypothetical protein